MLHALGFGMEDFRLKNEGLVAEQGSEAVVRSSRKSSGSNSTEWLVNVEEDVVVPMLTSEIVEAFRAGRVTQRSLVWRIGMHDWSILAEVPQLRLAVGPSALPATAGAPGPLVHAASAPPPDQQRRSTLPFGFPAQRDAASVREPSGLGLSTPVVRTAQPSTPARAEDAEALAVYDRPAASLTFAESMQDEWQGRASSPALNAPRLTPLPPASSRLPNRAKHSLAPNTLSPTTAEAALAESARRLGAFGDKSVVFASELRAAKKTSKRVALWAALGSAALASVATFLFAHSAARPADQVMAAPPLAAAGRAAPVLVNAVPEGAQVVASAAPLVSAVHPAVVLSKRAMVRVVKRAKPAPARVLAPVPEPVDAPAGTDVANDDTDDSKPSVAAALPLAAPAASATVSAAPATSAPPAAVTPAPDL